MEQGILLFKMIVVLMLSISLGNWFLKKARQVRAQGRPLYHAYLTAPGIIILLAILVPVVLMMLGYI
ncbi:MAG: hypothetical protein SWC96_11515 [Thermodesulfobacteriota bacterium]|nr:hypothetical protein [Thermodesulfobacteriota bacterium]